MGNDTIAVQGEDINLTLDEQQQWEQLMINKRGDCIIKRVKFC
jgi:hypothetical protein